MDTTLEPGPQMGVWVLPDGHRWTVAKSRGSFLQATLHDGLASVPPDCGTLLCEAARWVEQHWADSVGMASALVLWYRTLGESGYRRIH